MIEFNHFDKAVIVANNRVFLLKFFVVFFVAGFIFFAYTNSAQAAIKTWSGTTNGNWATGGAGGNWSGDAAPIGNDDLVFPAGGANKTMNNNLAALTFNSLDFSDSGYSVTGSAITLYVTPTVSTSCGAVVSICDSSASGNNSIALAISFGTAVKTINVSTLGETLSLITGVKSGALGGITKTGSGTLNIAGTNTYTGAVAINEGTLQAGSATATGTTAGGVTIASGATFDLNAQAVGAEAFNISGTGTSSNGVITNTSGTAASLSGLITLGGDATIMSNSGNIVLSAAGTITGGYVLTLSGSNAASSLASVIGTGANAVNKTGTGQWTLSGANTFTGGLMVKAGTLVGSTSTSAFGGTTGAITLGYDGGTANATIKHGFASNSYANPITVASGDSGIMTLGAASVAAPTWSGAIILNNHDLVIATTVSRALVVSGEISGTGNVKIAGDSGATTGTVTISGAKTFTGTITNQNTTVGASGLVTISGTITAGVTQIIQDSTVNTALSVTAAITCGAAGLTLQKTSAAGTSVLTVKGGVTGASCNVILDNDSATASGITIDATVNPGINNTGTITNQGTGTGTVLISGIISTNVTKVIQNSVTSQLTLSGANTFTSGLTIKAGTVSGTTSVSALGDVTGGGTNGTITLGDSSANNSAVTLKGSGLTFANPIVLADIANATGTITIAPSATSCIFSGGVTGTNDLILNGSSTFTLTLSTASVNNSGTVTNLNAGTGVVTISSVIGTNVTKIIQNSSTSIMILSAGNGSYAGGITIKSGTLRGSTTADALGTNTITIGDEAINADATLDVISTVTYVAPIVTANVSSGTLTISHSNSNTSPVLSGSITLSHDVVITSGRATFTLSGAISGTGNITTQSQNTNNGAIAMSGAVGSINNAGTITNNGNGTGAVTLSRAIGANITTITQSSSTSALTVSGAITTTSPTNKVFVSTGTSLFTISNAVTGITGTGSVDFDANSSGNFTVSATPLNNSNVITNSGISTGITTISGMISTNVTGVIQNSATSQLILTGNNTYINPTTINAGILNANTTTALGNGSSTNTLIFDGGTLKAAGTVTSPGTRAVTLNSTAIFDTNSQSISIAGVVSGAGGLTKQGVGTLTLSGATTVGGDFTITTGIIVAPAGTLTVGGNFSNSATFTHNSGTVALNTATTAIISGDTAFNILSVTGIGAAKIIQFAAGSTTTAGTFTVAGTTGNLVTLTSTTTDVWNINPIAASVDYADISYSNNQGDTICATNSTSAAPLTNTKWSISPGTFCGFTTSIEIRAQNYTSSVSSVTFPKGAPGTTVSAPYNNIDGSGNPQTFGGAGTAKPVITLYNGNASTLLIWYNITTFTNGVVSNEYYQINNNGAALSSANDITNAVTFDTNTSTGITILAGAGNEKDFYLKTTLSSTAGKTGTSTLTILGEAS